MFLTNGGMETRCACPHNSDGVVPSKLLLLVCGSCVSFQLGFLFALGCALPSPQGCDSLHRLPVKPISRGEHVTRLNNAAAFARCISNACDGLQEALPKFVPSGKRGTCQRGDSTSRLCDSSGGKGQRATARCRLPMSAASGGSWCKARGCPSEILCSTCSDSVQRSVTRWRHHVTVVSRLVVGRRVQAAGREAITGSWPRASRVRPE